MLQGFFVSIYDFLKSRKTLCWLLFVSTLCFWGVLASKVKFEEDITSMLPDSRAIRAMNDVISHTQAGEQIIFLVSFKDTSHTDPDSLINVVNGFNGQLHANCSRWIDTVSLQIGESYEESLLSVFQNNLPLFLTANDFRQLDTLLQPEHIKKTLQTNRKILLSPASVVYKQVIAQDPAGMSRLVWAKLKGLQFDPNYEIYNGYIFSNNERQLTFFLKPKYKSNEIGKNSKFFRELDQLIIDQEAKDPGIHITYFGGPAVAAGNAMQLRTDTIVTLSATIILLLALTYYFFRKKRIPLLLLVPVVYGATMGLAIMYLVQGSISVIALGAGAIILGCAIDYSIHFLAHAKHAKDIRSTIDELAQPLTIGSFTTIAAFFSLRFVHTPILQDLGLFAAISLTGAALCTLIFLPHFPLGIEHKEVKPTVFDKLALWQPESNKWLVLFIFLLTPVLLYFSFNVQFDNDLMHLNYLSPRMQKAQDEVSKANAYALSSVFLIANEDNEEHALQKLESVTPQLDTMLQKGWVRSASNPTLLLPSLAEQRKRIARWNTFWSENRKQEVLKAVNEYAVQDGYAANAFTSFKSSLDKTYTPFDTTTVSLLKTFFPGSFTFDKHNHYAIAALKVLPEHRKEVFKYLSKQNAVTITDRQQGAVQLVSILNKDFNNIAIYTTFIVFFALLIGYGRLELALISFLPMAISWVWILGLMALLGLKFNIVNIIISTLIFGLGDDYSIFTMDGMVEKYKHGVQKLSSIRAAVYVSAVTVFIGLGVLLLAKHPALRSIALISVTGMLCVVFISQTLQPFLFNWFIQNRANKKFLPFTFWSFAKSVFAFLYFFVGSLILTVLGILFTKLWPFNKEKGKYWYHIWISRFTWSMMYIMGNVRKRVYNISGEDFQKPAIYIANHSSFLDILITTMLNPKLVLLTNKWVWRSPVFGAVVRMAEYYPVIYGAEDSLDQLRGLIQHGYSIVIFPEGTRSYDDTIKRFHKGAFYIAQQLQLDIVPIVLHGVHYTMQKGDWLLKDGTCSVYIEPRIKSDNTSFGLTYSEKAKFISRWMRKEYAQIKEENETPRYFKEQLLRSYMYKGPVLEWYCRIKIRLEGYYEQFHELIPRQGKFYDLGCGYGFMTYMLHWASAEREFIGVDYDEDKIETAQNNFLRDEHIRFEHADITNYNLEKCDGIILSDVLHYLLPEEQEKLLDKCIAALNDDGILIIRDGVFELKDRHKGTKLTELFSTRIFKFNKTKNNLHFISNLYIENYSIKNGLKIEIIDKSVYTSNLIFILRKKLPFNNNFNKP
ncbi:MAG TPA: 1-acyl-sn-glycerol-3-phosphate acyltransferase [Flavipsychrobacter sp.]|nr:1-acyl-sn-glycerol-3-phosphate acyltransferase [Flavipsychrobacter sp.]